MTWLWRLRETWYLLTWTPRGLQVEQLPRRVDGAVTEIRL